MIKKPPVRRLRQAMVLRSIKLTFRSFDKPFLGQVYGMLSPRLRQILAEPLNLTPDPTGLQFKPGDPYATIPIRSGLKFGQARR